MLGIWCITCQHHSVISLMENCWSPFNIFYISLVSLLAVNSLWLPLLSFLSTDCNSLPAVKYSMPVVLHAFYMYFSYLNTQLLVYMWVSVSLMLFEKNKSSLMWLLRVLSSLYCFLYNINNDAEIRLLQTFLQLFTHFPFSLLISLRNTFFIH